MNPTNKKEIKTVSKSAPYNPSRRKSLSRMNDTTTKSPKTRRSKSPVPSTPKDGNIDAEISEDDTEDSLNHKNHVHPSPKNSRIPPLSSDDLESSSEKIGGLTTKTSPIVPPSPLNEKDLESIERKNVLSRGKYKIGSRPQKKPATSSISIFFFIGIFGLIASVAYFYFPWGGVFSILTSGMVESSIEDRMKNFRTDINRMKQKFQVENPNSWYDIVGGVEDLLNRTKSPWTFVLVSNDNSQISCFAELLGEISSKALLSNNRLVLHPGDFGKIYGDAIDHLRPRIKEKKVVVVHDLLKVHAGAIQAFHTMCDRENPLVNEAVYIITIITPRIIGSRSVEAFIENLLTKTFVNKVPDDKLQPLITRLTDGPIIQHVPAENPTTICSL